MDTDADSTDMTTVDEVESETILSSIDKSHGERMANIFSSFLEEEEEKRNPLNEESVVEPSIRLSEEEFHAMVRRVTCQSDTDGNKSIRREIIKPWALILRGGLDWKSSFGLFMKHTSLYEKPLASLLQTVGSWPVSQACIERLFHRLKRVRTPTRNRLSVESCNIQIFLYLNKYRGLAEERRLESRRKATHTAGAGGGSDSEISDTDSDEEIDFSIM